ncbi:hypothetical protein ACSBR2_016548 [Camellia fascicularis]
MASKILSMPLTLLFLVLISLTNLSYGGTITVYWGQNTNEGKLNDTGATNSFKIVNIAFLSEFGSGRKPVLNLVGHCLNDNCAGFSKDINYCQSRGIKVMLSIGGDPNTYSLSSIDDARQALQASYSQFFLTPQCPFPNENLKASLNTGLFNSVWIQFYNNPMCEYNTSNPINFKNSWSNWTHSIQAGKFFVGLIASIDAANNGFITPEVLKSQVLPFVHNSANYGGIMLWDRFHDKKSGYSDEVKNNV